MASVSPHPYRIALDRRDGQALVESLHPDVSFYTPAFPEPIHGRDNVLALFAALASVFEEPEIVDELAGEGTHAIVVRLSVEGHPIDAVDYLELDDEGLVRRITVMMRPLSSVRVLAERMRETIAALTG